MFFYKTNYEFTSNMTRILPPSCLILSSNVRLELFNMSPVSKDLYESMELNHPFGPNSISNML